MKQKDSITIQILAITLAVLSAFIFLARKSASSLPTEYFDIQISAARQLEQCFLAIKGYKEEIGILISPDDIHQTGIIGSEYTGITTTIGSLEAKRTAANPDMAALVVKMLHEAGVKSGDTVAAGFSGSFPGMNLAVVTACEAMDVKLVCIASAGSSTYGANDPELTFPEMMHRLAEDGIIKTRIAAVTMGGDFDIGAEMDPQMSQEVKNRLKSAGLDLVEIKDYAQNIAWRESLYSSENASDCFIAVGGNVTSLGRGEEGVSLGQGVIRFAKAPRIDENSGLVQRYMAKGIPVINLLNMKRIMAEYDMPFDPLEIPEIGTSAVYFEMRCKNILIFSGLAVGAALLILCYLLRRRKSAPNNPSAERTELL